MKRDPYGALLNEWDHFDLVLGLTDDLLPVVSDPHAVKSPDSKIQGPGKTPSDFNRRGEMRGFKDWTEYHATSKDVSRWAKDDRLGICLQTRVVRAIDVDVDDFDDAADIEAFICDRLGYTPPVRRRSNSSKFLMAVRIPGDFTKRRFKTGKGVIEFLANGQQFVGVGTHTSGVRYEWDGGLPDAIPELDPGEFEALWSALNEKFGTEESVSARVGITPAKKRQMADINDPLVAFLDDNLWVKDINRDGRVDITCPFESEHTTESGDSATSYYPAGVGGFEQGHFKCQHSHCDHRTDNDFKEAIGWTTHGFDEIETPATVDQEGKVVEAPAVPPELASNMHRTKEGQIKPNRTTLAVAMAYPSICGCTIGYDKFRDEIMRHDLSGAKRPIRDDDYYDLAMHLEQGIDGFQHIPRELMRDAVQYIAQRKQFDSAQDWLSTLPKWDGRHRIETFLRDFLGAEDTPYTRAVSLYFWTALAGRIRVPGIKADMVPIAVGKQGARKTSLIATIAPSLDMFLELDLSKKDDDLAREMRGKILAELGELKGIGARQVEHIKSFLSRAREEWVPKFKEFATRYSRRCVFFGTTNEDEPLPEDDTGQRRWLPFRVNEGHICSVESLVKVRDQLWAEAATLFDQRGVCWQDAERLATGEHSAFEKGDVWEEHLREYLFSTDMGDTAPIDKEGGLQLVDIIKSGLNMAVRDITISDERRVGKCLRKLGLKKTPRGGKKVWVRK